MRASVLALLLVLAAVPAAAREMRHNAARAAGARHLHDFHVRHHLHRTPFFAPGFFEGSDAPFAADPTPGIVVLNAAPPPAPVHAAGDERASVERTPQGVTVVRGPGSRHTAH